MKPEITLTRTMADALQRVHEHGPEAWCHGTRSRAGGAVSRMFDRMATAGLVSKAPHIPTPYGLRLLSEYRARQRSLKRFRE